MGARHAGVVFLGRRFLLLNGTALVVGAVAGLAAVGFRFIISAVEELSFQGTLGGTPHEENTYLQSPWGMLVIAVPLAGGILVGVIRRFWPETRQYGVTEVMAAVQAKGGHLRTRSSIGHAIISALTVGTGGSTGREGPIGYIGATLGSSLGRRFGLGARDIKVLLGAGFSAGIATSFNAPLGGVLMAIELVVPEFSTHAFIPIVVATVIGVTIGQILLQDKATFVVPEFTLNHPGELGAYLILGLLCGAAAVAFIRLTSWNYNVWTRLNIPDVIKPALGGLLVGGLGFLMLLTLGQYHVFGTGYATVTEVLNTSTTDYSRLWPLLVVLLVAKPVATSITVGSGGGGGMFSVSLYQGVLLGGLMGLGVHAIWPGADPASYALVGMGAFYAASTRATLTAIVILTELTRDYAILLPLMLAAVAADAVSVRYSKESLYTIKLSQKGILYDHDRVQSPLDFLQVKDVMTKDVHTLPHSMTVGEAFNRMADTGHTGYPVVDDQGKLMGILTRRDLSKRLHESRGQDTLGSVASGILITAFPQDMLHTARDRMFQEQIGRLLVVDPADRRSLLGILTRSDLLAAEAQMDVEHEDRWNG